MSWLHRKPRHSIGIRCASCGRRIWCPQGLFDSHVIDDRFAMTVDGKVVHSCRYLL